MTLPAFIDISSITVIDIKSVHVVSSNKNVAYLTYVGDSEQTFSTENYFNTNNVGASTQDNNNVDNSNKGRNIGNAAEWLSLHWTLQLIENTSLTFDIKSLGISSLLLFSLL